MVNINDTASAEAEQSDPLKFVPPAIIRPRAWLVGLPLLVGVCILSVYADMYSKVIQFGVLQFSPPAVVALFALALINSGSAKLAGKPLLNKAEMLIIYAMLLIGVMVSTRGIVEKLDGSIAYLPYLVCHSQATLAPLLRHMPQWMVPYDATYAASHPGSVSPIVKGFYEGNRGQVPWLAWIWPLCTNFALFGCVAIVFVSIGSILRRQWMDVEHLGFPLTSLPVSLINDDAGHDGKSLLSAKLFWVGFVVAFAIFALNGLHANYPSIPQLPLMFEIAPYFTTPPLNSITTLHAYCSLAVIGFAYFMPSEVLFSLWFFYILLQVQTVVFAMIGYPSTVSWQWQPYLTAGAYVVIAGAIFYQSRAHLAKVWRIARAPQTQEREDSTDLLSYRNSLIGLFAGFTGIMVWMCLAGTSFWAAFAQIAIYVFISALVMTRAVSQAGLLMTETSFIPLDLIQMVVPVSSLSAGTLTMFAQTNNYLCRDMRGELLAPVMDTQRTAGQVGQRPSTLLWPIIIAIPVAFIAASFAFLKLHYQFGGMSLYDHPMSAASREYQTMGVFINGGTAAPGSVSPGAFAVGIIITLILVACRAQYSWFPFHPLGFALAPTWALMVFWVGFLIAWIIRSVVLRYGGFKLFRQIAPLMLGLIVGEFSSAVFWSVLNMTYHLSAPEFPWP